MPLLQEFKSFALKGSMVDMAIGLIIGAAFSGVVNLLVADVIMPPFGVILGGVDFTDFSITLKSSQNGEPAVVLSYGVFITKLINFLVVAATIFLVIKGMNRLRRERDAEPQPRCGECLEEVRVGARRCCHCGSVLGETVSS